MVRVHDETGDSMRVIPMIQTQLVFGRGEAITNQVVMDRFFMDRVDAKVLEARSREKWSPVENY